MMQTALALLRQTWAEFGRHHAQWLAAALAYFAAFAVAPLIVVFVEVAGFFVHSHRHVMNEIFRYVDRDAGSGAHAIRQIVASSLAQPRNGVFAELLGWGIFIVAALGLFSATQFALNTVWDSLPAKSTLWTFLFVAGQFLVGWYLGRAGLASTYGVFGSLVAFLLWVNYSAQILLFGAEFTHVYARRFGSKKAEAWVQQ
jgi:uncharacterized BrkB/YihY/UPF0761 family membrane protein